MCCDFFVLGAHSAYRCKDAHSLGILDAAVSELCREAETLSGTTFLGDTLTAHKKILPNWSSLFEFQRNWSVKLSKDLSPQLSTQYHLKEQNPMISYVEHNIMLLLLFFFFYGFLMCLIFFFKSHGLPLLLTCFFLYYSVTFFIILRHCLRIISFFWKDWNSFFFP